MATLVLVLMQSIEPAANSCVAKDKDRYVCTTDSILGLRWAPTWQNAPQIEIASNREVRLPASTKWYGPKHRISGRSGFHAGFCHPTERWIGCRESGSQCCVAENVRVSNSWSVPNGGLQANSTSMVSWRGPFISMASLSEKHTCPHLRLPRLRSRNSDEL